MRLSPGAEEFIAQSPLLFVASRGMNGQLDVSPRGDDPRVLELEDGQILLLPDRRGNNRLDTVRNVIDRPDIALAVLRPGANRYLQIRGRAEISTRQADLQRFESNGEFPSSVARIHVCSAEFIQGAALEAAEFWSPTQRSLVPMDLFAIIKRQIEHHGGKYVPAPVQALSGANVGGGLQDAYQAPSDYVRRKAFATLDPYTEDLVHSSRLAVLAHGAAAGDIAIAMAAGISGFARAVDDTHISVHEPLSIQPVAGDYIGGLFIKPGQNETLRVNGAVVSTSAIGNTSETVINTTEIFLHCANSLARSRIWRSKKYLAWEGMREFICQERVRECEDVVSFRLSPADAVPLAPFSPGQFVTLAPPGSARDADMRRCYSLSEAPANSHLRITVKKLAGGRMSGWLHDQFNPGSRVLLGAPRGRFMLDESSSRTIALISAGVGLTPMVSMLQHLTAEMRQRPVWFIHGVRNGEGHAMRGFARSQAAANGALKCWTAYSRPRGDDRKGSDYDAEGRIDIATIEALLDIHGTDFYLCGPSEFMDSLKGALLERGVPGHLIRMEIFGSGGARTSDRAKDSDLAWHPHKVIFSTSGIETVWRKDTDSLLSLALNQGLDAPYICRSGDCQTCALRLLSGSVRYPEDSDVLPPDDQVLMCQAVPAEDVTIDL